MRDLYIIGAVCVAAIAIGGALYFFGPASFQEDAAQKTTTVPFTVITQGQHAVAVSARGNYRITSADQLKALWSIIYGASAKAPPAVDFTKHELLGVFDGSHMTSGYGISVTSVADTKDIRAVTITHSVPGSSCHPTAGSASPYEVIQVPKTPLSLAHIDTESTTTCP